VKAPLVIALMVSGCGTPGTGPGTPAAVATDAAALFAARDPAHADALAAVHHAPRIDGATFDPAALIRAVAALRPLGKDAALDVLRTYDELARAHRGRDDLDAQRIFLVVRALCDPPAPLAIGAPSLTLPPGLTGWPRFPLVERDGVPFLVVTGYTLAGKPESPLVHVDACRDHGTLRPATPAGEPAAAAEALIASPEWRAAIHDDATAAMVRAQAARAHAGPR
jgi:hypothetical protein